jgi:GNAT superfamily N-acetyltransferase
MGNTTIEHNGYVITTDKSLMNLTDIHKWLSTEAYWCKHIPFDVVKTAFDNSFCVGVIKDGKQVGYGRFITDYATFAYLADVYVDEKHRGAGLSKKMMEVIMQPEWVGKLRAIKLATVGAHRLYEKFGFTALRFPDRQMELSRPDVYGDQQNICQ